jgi:hypothetical protein
MGIELAYDAIAPQYQYNPPSAGVQPCAVAVDETVLLRNHSLTERIAVIVDYIRLAVYIYSEIVYGSCSTRRPRRFVYSSSMKI